MTATAAALPRRSSTASEDLSTLDAISEAQRIAFAPMLYQAVGSMLDLGILAFLDTRGTSGATVDEVSGQCSVSTYGAAVLLEAGVSGRVVLQQGEKFLIARAGRFLLHDKMTRVNFDFVRDVCYAGMAQLTEAVKTGKPAGLRVFGDWPTIYPALSSLPEPAKTSWFAFDHFYSDAAFGAALGPVFSLRPGHIYDVGGNTGKWALRCVGHHPEVRVTVLDLPEQVALLKKNVAGAPGAERIEALPVDMLGESPLPGEADVWWMSQFLDCFSEEQVIGILRRIRASMKPGAKVCILEPFCDRQTFDAGAFSLNAGSLYFTCLANGNSRFYRAKVFTGLVERAGLVVEQEVDKLGAGEHTLLVCARKN
ncbi:MAG: SAM-dependent methyltransferase [Puniceicoccales bacterium]|jgi:hypothetical protein|nr:SAM-dependent methyltransferase [Puniceicoccales bacterium]